ncbi:MAG TPA: hypothetical protein VHU84_18045 [Lacipirellulaceae bacterium]|nr:hypothetical protein [Lacipirellulaceae bacterium]
MSNGAESETEERAKWSPWAIAAAALLLLIFSVIIVGTFRGYFFINSQEAAKLEEDQKKKEEEEKKKKAEFDISSPIVMPSEPKVPLPLVKPGHWETTSQTMTANYRNFIGDSRISIVNNQNQPYPIAKTPFSVRASRPVLLTKARSKNTETTVLIPETTQAINLYNELEERSIGYGMYPIRTPLTPMPSYEYNFVVLAKEPSRYSFIKTLDSVKVPFDGESDADDTTDPIVYNVVQLAAGQSVALPDNPLTWTTTAYLLWDEVDPGDPFTPEQKKALVDWIEWGGQLVINGPNSLDLLKGSFLEPYLPATNGGTRKIAADDPAIAELNDGWLISTQKYPGEPLKPVAPWSAIKLALHPNARFLPKTGELFAERQIGRGRIVVSAVQLSERDLINWRSGFESMFNACILRRPARVYRPGYFGDVTLMWAENKYKERRLDAALNTRLRFFARDLGVDTAYHHEDVTEGGAPVQQYGRGGQPVTIREYRPPTNAGGLGAWSDFSVAADAARGSLREAAGVEVPGAGFVVLCLAAYLVALVPINWLVFRTLGHVEWAWIAAPVIAIAGTWIIVQRAQLDIGFVRAHTEIGILEQQPEHPRAHLSRFTALYASLSTTYDFQFPNLTTLIAPFPSKSDFQMLIGDNLTNVSFQRYEDVRLIGLPISSNSTGMVHSEQMQTLDGPIRIGKSKALGNTQIENHTKLDLHSVCVVRKPTEEEVKQSKREMEGLWIGELSAGQSAAASDRMPTLPDKKITFGEERTTEARLIHAPRLNLEPMFQFALNPDYMEDGETRLVARCDEVQPGEKITPEASQVRGTTLVVVHLQYAPPAAPEKDKNTRRDIKGTDDRPNEDESNSST